MEVREAYCSGDFDWAQCQQLAAQHIQESNVGMLRRHAARAFGGSLAGGSEEPGQEPRQG